METPMHSVDIQKIYSRMTKKGRNFEHDLCADIYQATNHELIPEPIGYSGNHFAPSPDISIDDGTKLHAMELKNTSKDRITFYYDPDDKKRDDIYQLLEYARKYPRTVIPYVGVNFDRRQLLLIPLWLDGPNDRAAMRSATKMTPCDVSLTYADNLSVQKPSTDVWPSAKAGDDVEYVLETIGYDR